MDLLGPRHPITPRKPIKGQGKAQSATNKLDIVEAFKTRPQFMTKIVLTMVAGTRSRGRNMHLNITTDGAMRLDRIMVTLVSGAETVHTRIVVPFMCGTIQHASGRAHA